MNQRGNALLLGILIGLVIAGGLFILYYFGVFKKQSFQSSNKKPSEIVRTNIIPSPTSSTTATVFKINEIKVGDKIGQMTVQSIEPFDQISSIPELSGLSENNFRITFSGQVTLTGKYEIIDFSQGIGGGVTAFFTPDIYSSNILPKEAVAYRNAQQKFFIFNNNDEAIKSLTSRGNGKTVKIIIDNYTLRYFPTETNNSADFIRVE